MGSGRSRFAGPGLPVLVPWVALVAISAVPNTAVGGHLTTRVMLCVVTVTAAAVLLGSAFRHERDRSAWLLVGVGFSGYAAGFVIQFFVTHGEHDGPGGLNWSDCASLCLYPFAYAGLMVFARSRSSYRGLGSVLEGALAAPPLPWRSRWSAARSPH